MPRSKPVPAYKLRRIARERRRDHWQWLMPLAKNVAEINERLARREAT